MNEKLINVYFGVDNLPYKDTERQVHFPIVGGAFLGASNTTKIRFYYDYIGDSASTWVSVAKLPNGKQGSQVLSKSSDDNGNYAELELSNWYTQAKGDVYIALQGYSGGVEYSYDDDTGLYEIHGTPTIQTTGSIKLAINYAPVGDYADYNDEFTDYQRILAGLGDKVDKIETSGTYAYTHNGSTQNETPISKNADSETLVQRDGTQINVPTTPTSDSNATSKKYVDDNIQDVREVAEGKCKNVCLSYNKQVPTTDSQAQALMKPDGTHFTNLQDFTDYIGFNAQYLNPDFNSQSNAFAVNQYKYIITMDNYVLLHDYITENYNSGDIFLVYETDVPDRWAYIVGSGLYFFKLETTKIDLSTYATKTEVNEGLASKQNTLVNQQNIKSINGESLLGSGNIEIQGGGGGSWGTITGNIQDQTDLQNELQDIRKVAEGKNKSLVIRYDIEAPTSDISATMFKKIDGTYFTSLSDFNSYVSGLSIANPSFNTQGNVELTNYYIIGENLVVYRCNDISSKFKVGDIVLIIQTDVPDRWFSFIYSAGAILSKLETTKVDISGLAGLEDLANEYDNTLTYTKGEVVYHGGNLYRAKQDISTAEDWDSTHWEQISVASDFVNLTGTQTITGNKTFTTMLTLQGTTRANMIRPNANNSYDLGASSYYWKDLYLSGNIQLKDANSTHYYTLNSNQYGNLSLNFDGTSILAINNTNGIIVKNKISPLSSNTFDLGDSSHNWKDLYLDGKAYFYYGSNDAVWNISQEQYGRLQISRTVSGTTSNYYHFDSTSFTPVSNNSRDLGTRYIKWKDGYFAGQVYAQNTFKVIKANEIGANNVLTQDQIDLIYAEPRSLPVLIQGSLSGNYDTMLCGLAISSNEVNGIAINGRNIHSFHIEKSTRVLTFDSSDSDDYLQIKGTNVNNIINGIIKFFDAPDSGSPTGLEDALKAGYICYINGNTNNSAASMKYGAMLFPTKGTTSNEAWGLGYYFNYPNHERITLFQYRGGGISSYNWINLSNILSINGKEIPAYPANANWKGEWIGTQAEYNALSTYDSNTTYYIIED